MNIVLIPKDTKIEHDRKRRGLGHRQVIASYGRENVDAILASHRRQLAMRRRVIRLFPGARVLDRDGLGRRTLGHPELVIALGGDNHFTYVSHFLDRTGILGVNADRVRSHGGLLAVDETTIDETAARVRAGRLRFESWTRLEVAVDGRRAGRAISEIYAGEAARRDMSRHVIEWAGQEEEQRSSGLLVATGAGSTGWYGACGAAFGRGRRLARWSLTEPFPRDRRYRLGRGAIGPGETLTVRSRHDAGGVISVDCLDDTPFPWGSVARFALSDQPLRVAR